jgi:hypothetical protein
MTRTEPPVEALRGYLRQLTPQTRARLLAELDRLRQSGEDFPGVEIIVAELSSEPRAPAAPPVDRLDHAARHFFRVLDPYLTNRPPERANDGQISRASLQPIWDWVSRDLMASMARGYAAEVKQLLTAGKQREVDQAAHGFQNKAVKYLQGTLAAESGTEQARARLGKHGGSAATSGDLVKILRVLKARDALAALDADLPSRIDKLDGRHLDRTLAALKTLRTAHADAVPFALAHVTKRLAVPWQLLRLATRGTETKEADDIAATPYAIAVVLVLDQLEDEAEVLRAALRSQHVVRAKEILTGIYDVEYAIRVRIELDDSDWGRRLDAIMQAVTDVLDSEQINLPAGLNHVLRSRSLRQHHSLIGRLTWFCWKCRDAVKDSPAYARQLIATLCHPLAWSIFQRLRRPAA